jgi:anti-anti-sigma factor
MSVETVRGSLEIDLTNIAEFDSCIDRAITGSSCDLVIDLSETVYVDSAGVASIITAYKRIHAEDRCLTLVLGAKVEALFSMLCLDKLPGMCVSCERKQ